MAKKWTYTNEEVDYKLVKPGCYDCGLVYGGPAWVDVLVTNEIWEKISPSPHNKAGLLCFNCIAARLKFLGLSNVDLFVTSGTFNPVDKIDLNKEI